MNHKKKAALAVLAASASVAVGAQGTPASGLDSIGISVSANYWAPKILDPDSPYAHVIGSTAQFSIAPLPFMEALARVGVQSIRLDSNESLLYVGGSVGLGFTARLYERLSVNAAGFAGLGKLPDYNKQSYGLYEIGARLEASLRLSAALSLGLSAGYERLATPTSDFMDAISAGIRLKLSPVELRHSRSNLAFESVDTQAIFPVLRSWYDTEPLGTVRIRNNEDGHIENVRVSFYAPEYMGGPRLSTVIPRMERGQSVVVPLYAVFDERVLALTENSTTAAHINAEYSFLGSQRNTSEGLTLSFHHRNAMSWEDDRRAAAFVSPTDPAALWFSRYASSIVRDRIRTELPPNLQYALGIFEALKLYGMNYVIDPNSAYIDMSENAAVIDYLQYPSQTLMYRGGDCDDLSILYCSLLESSGIHTAFITIPGHIYMALDLGISEAEAREQFFDPGLLIFRNGRAWAPIEITMVKDGFVKAWRVGAKQWMDNDQAGTAEFFPMQENWQAYRPSGLQNVNARFDLPDEALSMSAFDIGVDRLVVRELEPLMADYEKRLSSRREPEILNEYGMAMARVGMLDAAWERFAEAAKADFPWAWNNLASIAFVRKDYALAYSYYEWATSLIPGDPVAVLGMARSAYELDRYSESTILYDGLAKEAPVLAERFSYLASVYGGTGRAWSMADRLSSSIWSRPGVDFKTPGTPAAPAVAQSAPTAEELPLIPQAPVAVTIPLPTEVPVPTALVLEPELTPEPKTTLEPEPEFVTTQLTPEPEPAAITPSLEPQPEPIAATPAPEPITATPAPEPVSEPLTVAITPATEADVETSAVTTAMQEPERVPIAVAITPAAEPEPTPKPAVEPTPTRPAPPNIIDKPPEDADIAQRSTAIARATTSTTIVAAPVPRPAAPAIQARPPEDADVASRTLPQETTPVSLVAPPPPTPVAVPDPEPHTEPVPVQDPEPHTEPVPMPTPEPVIESEPKVESEPVIEPAPTPEPLKPAQIAQLMPAPTPQPTPIPAAPKRATVLLPRPEPVDTINFNRPDIRLGSGSWTLANETATMTDPKALWAKLILPIGQKSAPSSYEFQARSTGSGKVGFGLHLHGRGEWELKHYGGGDSILVWITSDPEANGDAKSRIQIYRSRNEVDMSMIASAVLAGSAFDFQRYRIDYDTLTGQLAIYQNDTLVLKSDGLENWSHYGFTALRAMDTAEFQKLKITSLAPGSLPRGDHQ